ncbi:hypothetical protein [Flavobacterium sp. 3HN19-14]|uniref:hypothetical protein n=1 Tax=Flavobacterium sp. 3HN19-14 TaxID=3448133 RepID=UPI003EDEBB04
MKSTKLILGIAVIALGFTSCKDEKQEVAQKRVDTYVVYVDSLENVSDAKTNWEAIDAAYQVRVSEAEAALADLKDKTAAQEKLDASKAKYDALKAKVVAEMAQDKAPAANPKQIIRDAYFGAGKVGEDMNFSWVNKDNILQTYQNFYDTFEANKDNYSREDFDEIKALYEALDARKNTVEKEGLTGEDNRKIASIKVRFAPKFKIERIGAKASENKDAKEEAK